MTRCLVATMLLLAVHCGIAAAAMDGEWVAIAQIRGGKQIYDRPAECMIREGTFYTVRSGITTELGKITEVDETSPNQYDVEMTVGEEHKTETFAGIFAISGDTMFTCVNPQPGGERPTQFQSTESDGSILTVWVRKSEVPKIVLTTEESDEKTTASQEAAKGVAPRQTSFPRQ